MVGVTSFMPNTASFRFKEDNSDNLNAIPPYKWGEGLLPIRLFLVYPLAYLPNTLNASFCAHWAVSSAVQSLANM